MSVLYDETTYIDMCCPNVRCKTRRGVAQRSAAPHDVALQIIAPKSTAWHGIAWQNTTRHGTAEYGTGNDTADHGTVRRTMARYSRAEHGTIRHSRAPDSTAQQSTAQHACMQCTHATQHNATQHISRHGTAYHSTAYHTTAQTQHSTNTAQRRTHSCIHRWAMSGSIAWVLRDPVSVIMGPAQVHTYGGPRLPTEYADGAAMCMHDENRQRPPRDGPDTLQPGPRLRRVHGPTVSGACMPNNFYGPGADKHV